MVGHGGIMEEFHGEYPLPCVIERSWVVYPNISSSGIWARIYLKPFLSPSSATLPLRGCDIADHCTHASHGDINIHFHDGFKDNGVCLRQPRLSAPIDAASLNASSEESTSWYEPSTSSTFILIRGYPRTTPFSRASLIPVSMLEIYSLGMAPPTILFSNTKSAPSWGDILSTTWPYWPLSAGLLDIFTDSLSPSS